VLVHAGLHPDWTITEAAALARLAELHLRGDHWRQFVALSRESQSGQLRENMSPLEAAATAMSILTRIRICNKIGYIDHSFKQTPEQIPPGFFPWYAATSRREESRRILFGHWAALGQRTGDNWTSLDDGCVWGQRLCMLQLESGVIAHVSARN
jgi:bis(5'-nucleosyl)-tetraphosphatase (symmetrical)